MYGYGNSMFLATHGILARSGSTGPVNTVAPAITGTAVDEYTLTCSTGTWTGTAPITYAYQWTRNGSNIGSATNSTYTLVTADVGQSILCVVTATDITGNASANSNTVTPISNAQYFINQAGITDPTQQSAINTLVTDLKGYNIWTKFKAIYPIVGGTAATHKWNLKDPRDLDAAYRLLFSSGWTHSSTGMTPVNAYADAKLAPNVMAQNSAHLSFYSRTNANTNSVDMGSDLDIPTPQSSFSVSIKYNAVSGMLSRINAEFTMPSYNPTVTTGFFAVSRINSSEYKQFENGVVKATVSSVSQTPNIYNIVIGAWNRKNVIQDYSTKQCAFASIGDGLTDTEAANFYTAVQAFQTTLSRQV